MSEQDVTALRAAGLDDRGIVDANQVVAYFNYVNRVADGLGVELETSWPAAARLPRGYRAVVAADALPWLTTEQMRELDRIAIEELGIPLERMTENAGRHLATLAVGLLGGSARARNVLVLAGPGGNGVGGLAAARHLAAAGARVHVVLSGLPEALVPAGRAQHQTLVQSGIPVSVGTGTRDVDLVLDALLGYSQTGPPRGRPAQLIEATAGLPTLALDTPSGLELAASALHEPHMRATATLTLAAPKDALRSPRAERATGELFLADIALPPVAFDRLGVPWRTPFAAGPIVRIER